MPRFKPPHGLYLFFFADLFCPRHLHPPLIKVFICIDMRLNNSIVHVLICVHSVQVFVRVLFTIHRRYEDRCIVASVYKGLITNLMPSKVGSTFRLTVILVLLISFSDSHLPFEVLGNSADALFWLYLRRKVFQEAVHRPFQTTDRLRVHSCVLASGLHDRV